MRTLFCEGPGLDGEHCGRPTYRGELCQSHVKQKTRGNGPLKPLEERLTPIERAMEIGFRLLECDDNDDASYRELRRNWIVACKTIGNDELKHELTELRQELELERSRRPARTIDGEAVKAGLARARARGVRIGRPPKVAAERVRTLVEDLRRSPKTRQRATAVAAEIFRVSPSTVRRLARA